jgi:hypothetical protein
MSRSALIFLLLIPVLVWAAVSYASLPFVVTELHGISRAVAVAIWALGSFAYLVGLRALARANRRNRERRSRAA